MKPECRKSRQCWPYHHGALEEFKEVGEAGKGQAIVIATELTLEEAGDGDPLLTQLDQIREGWARAIVSTSGLQFHLCTYFWLPRQAPKRGRSRCGVGESLPAHRT